MSRPTVVIVCILAPPNRGGLNSTHVHGTSVPVEEPSTASRADIATSTSRPDRKRKAPVACGRGWESRSSRRLHCSLRHAFQPTVRIQDSVAVTLIGHKRSSRNARSTHRFDPLSPRRPWLERIAKVLGLAGYLPIIELHYAHRVRRLPIVSKDE